MTVDLEATQKFLTREINQKKILELGKNVGHEFIKEANKSERNFNNSFRSMAMGAASLIPYGGMALSSIVGLIRPETPHEDQI